MMSKDSLERNVLQAAISARRALNLPQPQGVEEGCYEVLKAAETLAEATQSGDLYFIRRMRETYEEQRRERYESRQGKLFDDTTTFI